MRTRVNYRVLVIDDNRTIHDDFRRIFQDEEEADGLDFLVADLFGDVDSQDTLSDDAFELGFACQGKDGVDMVKSAMESGDPFDVVFVDMRMPPGWDGFETLRRIWEIDKACKTILCTAYSDYRWDQVRRAAPLMYIRLFYLRSRSTLVLSDNWHQL